MFLKKIGTTFRKTILAHNTKQDLEDSKGTLYNDEIKFSFKPREMRIIEFTESEDKEDLERKLVYFESVNKGQ